MKIVGIIQARMGSSRLPGKVLKEVVGKPLIQHVFARVGRSRLLDEVWLATSERPENDPLEACVRAQGYPAFRGSEDDVLDRFYQLAKGAGADIVVRLTGDCPLHDAAVIDTTVQAFLEALPQYTYGANIFPATYPDGLDTEVFTFAALEELALQTTNQVEREHVTLGIHRQYHADGDKPAILNVTGPADFSHMRWTVDTAEDFEFVSQVFQRLYPANPAFGWMDIVALLTRYPSLMGINHESIRNEKLWQEIESGQLDAAGA